MNVILLSNSYKSADAGTEIIRENGPKTKAVDKGFWVRKSYMLIRALDGE